MIDLRDGTITVLPGATFEYGGSAALAFSPDGHWLIAAVAIRGGTRVLLYGPGGDGPYDTGLTIPGPTFQPVLIAIPS